MHPGVFEGLRFEQPVVNGIVSRIDAACGLSRKGGPGACAASFGRIRNVPAAVDVCIFPDVLQLIQRLM